MKKLLFLILLLIFITGCSQKITCDKPYLKVGDSCCLDTDNNNICDTHERAQEIIIQEVDAECTIESDLKCVDMKTTEERVELIIENVVGRDITIHSIDIINSDCGRTFDKKHLRGKQEAYVIPCKLAAGSQFKAQLSIEYWEKDNKFTRSGIINSKVEEKI